jgi:hypothetical protein
MKPENFRDLMRLVHGFEAAKILLVANDLGLFRQLDRARRAAEVAGELKVDARALELLMGISIIAGSRGTIWREWSGGADPIWSANRSSCMTKRPGIATSSAAWTT